MLVHNGSITWAKKKTLQEKDGRGKSQAEDSGGSLKGKIQSVCHRKVAIHPARRGCLVGTDGYRKLQRGSGSGVREKKLWFGENLLKKT